MDGIDNLTYEQNVLKANKARRDAYELQQAKLRALRDALSDYGDFRYVDLGDFIDPDNQNWADYKYKVSSPLVGINGHINAGTPVGMFIQKIRDAENIDNVNEQFKIWNSSKPLDSYDNGISYIRHFIPRFAMHSTTPSVDSRPVQATADDAQGAQGTQGVQGVQAGNAGGAQGAQAGVQAGAGVVKGGTQGSNNGSGGTQGTQGVQAGGTTGKPRMSDDEIDAFLKEELGGDTTGNGTYASPGVPKGGTKTIGYDDPYDPNPGNVSLAYVMRNAPEQERRDALINKWNRENGRESVPYVPGTEIPAGSLNRSSSTYASPGISTGGTYATGEGIKDANGNVLTNPGEIGNINMLLRIHNMD